MRSFDVDFNHLPCLSQDCSSYILHGLENPSDKHPGHGFCGNNGIWELCFLSVPVVIQWVYLIASETDWWVIGSKWMGLDVHAAAESEILAWLMLSFEVIHWLSSAHRTINHFSFLGLLHYRWLVGHVSYNACLGSSPDRQNGTEHV